MSSRLHVLALAMALGGLGACAPVSRVILLPQADGTTGKVEARRGEQAVLVASPYQTAELTPQGSLRLGTSSAEEVGQRHPQLLALQPAAPQRFMLFFAPGGAHLTPASEAELGHIVTQAGARPGGEILVIGHTDRVGSLEANDALSLVRARAIRDLLIARGFQPELIEAVGRGEREPVVPTADEVDEPGNRRAEIVVR